MKKLALVILLFFCIQLKAYAQYSTVDKKSHFVTYIDIGAGTTSIEMGISARLRERLATGIFAMSFHNPSFNNMFPEYIIGMEGKYYVTKKTPELYIGPIIGAHGFWDKFRPVIGINTGFDIYSGNESANKSIEMKLGLDIHAGINTRGNAFAGLSLLIGFGWGGEPFGIDD